MSTIKLKLTVSVPTKSELRQESKDSVGERNGAQVSEAEKTTGHLP